MPAIGPNTNPIRVIGFISCEGMTLPRAVLPVLPNFLGQRPFSTPGSVLVLDQRLSRYNA